MTIEHDANEAPGLTVRDLIRDLSRYPDDARVVVWAECDHLEDCDLELTTDSGRVVIRTDAGLLRRLRASQ